MLRIHPKSTLFPYTPLFRSNATVNASAPLTFNGPLNMTGGTLNRSAGHTAELQSKWNRVSIIGAGKLTTGVGSITNITNTPDLTNKSWDNYGTVNLSAHLAP